jgi:hypothetical protein
MEHVSNSQGVKVNVLLATHLRTQSSKSNLVFLLRKFSKKRKKESNFLKYEFGNSLSKYVRRN